MRKFKKLKMKSTAAGPMGSFVAGVSYRVPEDISEGQAKTWIGCGAAEWDQKTGYNIPDEIETTSIGPEEKAVTRGRPRKATEEAEVIEES